MLLLLGPLLALATPPPALPLTSLRLYETGVGHFERQGRLDKGATLPLPLGHLDDAIKTLTLRSDGKAPTLHFPSRLSPGMARALANLPAEVDAVDHRMLLTSLKGASVKVKTGGKDIQGRVVDVVEELDLVSVVSGDDGKSAFKERAGLVVLLMSDAGELTRIALKDLQSIQPTNPAHLARLRGALDALSTNGRFALELAPSSTQLTAGYVTEVPVWRATWRVFLDGKTARIQGFALLHNDTDEPWENVKVQLLSGRPTSFVYPLAAPRYAQRDLVTPSENLSTVPQLLGTTPDALWGENAGSLGIGGLGTSGHGYGSGGGGMSMHSSVTEHTGGPTEPPPIDDTPQGSPLFAYALAAPLSLPPHQSALVPFVDTTVDATRITLLGPSGGNARAVVKLSNSTGQTLPSGPITLQESGAYSGEAVMDRLAGLQTQWLDFAEEQDVKADRFQKPSTRAVTHVASSSAGLVERITESSPTVWTITNLTGGPRRVHVTLPATGDVTGASSIELDEERRLGVLSAPPGVSRTTLVNATKVRETVTFDNVTSELLKKLMSAGTLPAPDVAGLKEILTAVTALEAGQQRAAAAQTELEQATADVERLREHLKSAPNGTKLVDRVLKAEDVFNAARKRAQDEEHAVQMLAGAVKTAVLRLKPDVD